MWRSFSLRTRICLSLCILFLFVALAAVFLLREFASEQLVEENEPAARSAVVIAAAINEAVNGSPEPYRVLDAFAATLAPDRTMAIAFRPVGGEVAQEQSQASDANRSIKRAPAWFVRFLDLPDIRRLHPIQIAGQHVGDIVFEPTLDAEIHEKWIGFLAIMATGTGLALFTILIAYITIGSALRPLRNLGLGLARLRVGNYAEPIVGEGPPEIALSCAAANDLAATLDAFHRENRSLLRRMVSVQDDERCDIARELHDELGPLLFSIRANAIAMADATPKADDGPAHRVISSVEALQSTNRRILDRLRPYHIAELGIVASINTLIRSTRSQFPELSIQSDIDSSIGAADAVVAQTIYRVLQEGVTNVLRHANATHVVVRVAIQHDWLTIEVLDDGVGLATDFKIGRGLTGMRERVRALGGEFELLRLDNATCVRCRIPLAPVD